MLSLHLSADRPVPFNRFGNTKSHAPAAQFQSSRLATEGFFPTAAVEEELLSVELSLPCRMSSLGGTVVMRPKVELGPGTHEGYPIKWQVAAIEADWTRGDQK